MSEKNRSGKYVRSTKFKKVYGNEIKYEALKGINLTVQDGEFIGIMDLLKWEKYTFKFIGNNR